jgi:hypothetical protein
MENENTVTAKADMLMQDGTTLGLIKDKTYEIIVDEYDRIGIVSEYWDSPHFFSKGNLYKYFYGYEKAPDPTPYEISRWSPLVRDIYFRKLFENRKGQ